MTEFNIKTLPFGGGVELTNNDLNVVRENNLDNCLIIRYNNLNFIKTYLNQNILNKIKNDYTNLDALLIKNVFMNRIYFDFNNIDAIDTYDILIEFKTSRGHIIKELEL